MFLRNPRSSSSCQVLFPALTVVFLLPSLFGQQYTTLLVAFLIFGFEVVNLLLIITCAVYTIRNGLPSSPLYALCIGTVLLSMAVGSGLAELLGPALSDDLAHAKSIYKKLAIHSRQELVDLDDQLTRT